MENILLKKNYPGFEGACLQKNRKLYHNWQGEQTTQTLPANSKSNRGILVWRRITYTFKITILIQRTLQNDKYYPYMVLQINRLFSSLSMFEEFSLTFCYTVPGFSRLKWRNNYYSYFYIWNPHDYRIYYLNFDLRHQYGISVAA